MQMKVCLLLCFETQRCTWKFVRDYVLVQSDALKVCLLLCFGNQRWTWKCVCYYCFGTQRCTWKCVCYNVLEPRDVHESVSATMLWKPEMHRKVYLLQCLRTKRFLRKFVSYYILGPRDAHDMCRLIRFRT